MKKIGQNIVIFILLLGIAYFQPVFFPFSTKKVETGQPLTTKTETIASPKRLKTEGLAQYIGKSSLSLQKAFGLPKKSYAFQGVTWYVYQKGKCTLQVAVQNHHITDILAFGNKAPVAPFKIGMSLNDLAPYIDLMTEFQLTSGKKKYTIEVSEDDLVSTPFIAFENGSEAFLQFDHQGILQAVYYGDTAQFLRNMPYRLETEEPDKPHLLTDKKGEETHYRLVQQTWQTLLKYHVQLDPTLNQEAKQTLSDWEEKVQDMDDSTAKSQWQAAFHNQFNAGAIVLPEKQADALSHQSLLIFGTRRDVNVELVHQFYDLNAHKIMRHAKNIRVGLAHQGQVWAMVVQETEE